MRILFVCTVPTEQSGIPNVIFNFISSLSKFNVQLGYVSINQPSDIYRNKLDEFGANLYIVPRKISNPFTYIRQLARISRNYDIIHVHGNSATMVLEMIAAKLGGIKVRIAHSHNTKCNMKLIDFIFRPLFYRLCNARLACGEDAGRWLFREKSFTVFNNGIDPLKYQFNSDIRKKIRNSLSLNNTKVIGHIGNFVEQKNHSFLISLFELIEKKETSCRLLLLGDGPLRKEIEERLYELNLNDKVIITGSVSNPEDYMNAMDIVIMPSLFEGLPLTLVEEQANGLNIIASDVITSDANLTGNISYISLSKSIIYWRDIAIEKLKHTCRIASSSLESINKIKSSSFDIQDVGAKLFEYYKKIYTASLVSD